MEITKIDVIPENIEFAPKLPMIKMVDFVTTNKYQETANRRSFDLL